MGQDAFQFDLSVQGRFPAVNPICPIYRMEIAGIPFQLLGTDLQSIGSFISAGTFCRNHRRTCSLNCHLSPLGYCGNRRITACILYFIASFISKDCLRK